MNPNLRLAREAKAVVVLVHRNGPIEDLHAAKLVRLAVRAGAPRGLANRR